ncbi:MAG: hypothetical protein U5R06_16770 [candidate division KSB1 bacterium]|nr:hypothetical protein [candidate division KSB1 bacterium]
MKFRYIIVVFLLTNLLSAEPLHLSLRSMWVLSHENQEQVRQAEQLFNQLQTYMQETADLQYVSIDSLQFSFGDVLLRDFDSYARGRLEVLDAEYELDVLCFCYADVERKSLKFRIETRAFPSGLPVTSRTFDPAHDTESLTRQFQEFVDDIRTQKSQYGFPFVVDEHSILFLSPSRQSKSLQSALHGASVAQQVLNRYQSQKMRVQLTLTENPGLTPGRTDSLCSAMNADVLVNLFDSTLTLAVSPPQDRDRLPYWPQQHAFRRLDCAPDSFLTEALLFAFYGEKALGKVQQALSTSPVTDCHRGLAWLASIELSGPDSAGDETIPVLDQCYQTLLTAPENGWTYANYGGYLMQTGQYERALTLLENAETLFTARQQAFGLQIVLALQGETLLTTGFPDRARLFYERAADVAEERRDHKRAARYYFRLADISNEGNDPLQLWADYEARKQQLLLAGDTLGAARSDREIGELMRDMEQYDTSRRALQRYLDAALRLSSDTDIARAYLQLARTQARDGNIREAVEFYWSAADYYEILGKTGQLAHADEQLSRLYIMLGDLRQANARCNSALRLYESESDTAGQVRCMAKAGFLAALEGRYSESLDYFDDALSLAADTGPKLMALVLYIKARTQQAVGEDAAETFQQAQQLSGGIIPDVVKELSVPDSLFNR